MAYHLHNSWIPLLGQNVEIHRGEDIVDSGTVDAVTPDDQYLWLNPDGTKTRRMIERAEGLQVWVNYAWESD